MNRIASFTVNHNLLDRGVYVSRIDGDAVTYDIRMKKPNGGDYLSPKALHTIEHLLATYVRNSVHSDSIIYTGPMGCRTGFYLLLAGDHSSNDVLELVTDCFRFVRDFEGDVPGASAKDCGNYLDMNLPMANYWGRKYAALLENIDRAHLVYPE